MRQNPARLWLIGLFVLSGCDSAQHELRMVTPASPVDREIAEDLATLLDEKSSVNLTLTESALAGEAALEAISSGSADIALVSNNLPFRNDIATVVPLYPTVLHIAQREPSNALAGPEMLRGATIFAGLEGSASRLIFERIVEHIGLGDDDYRFVDGPEEEPDIIIVFAPISPSRVAKLSNFYLASMGTPQDIGAGGIIDAMIMLNNNFRPFVIPVGTYGAATPRPIVTVAVDKILVARNSLDATIVYDLINEILRHRPALAASKPGLFQQLSEDFDSSRSSYIVHAGTQAYMQRDAPGVMERYSGVAEVAVTLFVALGSALFAGIRIFKMRRKNRIDRYYAATMDIRKSVKDSTDPAARQQAIEKVRDLQNEAFDLLVDEKLAADESFRIFITLSNDVLQQLGATGIDDHLSST